MLMDTCNSDHCRSTGILFTKPYIYISSHCSLFNIPTMAPTSPSNKVDGAVETTPETFEFTMASSGAKRPASDEVPGDEANKRSKTTEPDHSIATLEEQLESIKTKANDIIMGKKLKIGNLEIDLEQLKKENARLEEENQNVKGLESDVEVFRKQIANLEDERDACRLDAIAVRRREELEKERREVSTTAVLKFAYAELKREARQDEEKRSRNSIELVKMRLQAAVEREEQKVQQRQENLRESRHSMTDLRRSESLATNRATKFEQKFRETKELNKGLEQQLKSKNDEIARLMALPSKMKDLLERSEGKGGDMMG